MIHVTWPPGCYGNYVMQCIYAYSNLSNGADLKIEADGSSHGFALKKQFFTYDHKCKSDADIIICPVAEHSLDYVNNQLIKKENNNIIQTMKLSFPNFKKVLESKWDNISTWSIREWISFWMIDSMKDTYHKKSGHFTTNDLFNSNIFPHLINRLGLTLVVDDAIMKHNQSNWIAQQRYHNSQHRCNKWVQDVLTDNNTLSPCQTILDEAYVQHCLREQGYEIRCDGLDNFPTNSRDLRELTYENSNTNNQ